MHLAITTAYLSNSQKRMEYCAEFEATSDSKSRLIQQKKHHIWLLSKYLELVKNWSIRRHDYFHSGVKVRVSHGLHLWKLKDACAHSNCHKTSFYIHIASNSSSSSNNEPQVIQRVFALPILVELKFFHV